MAKEDFLYLIATRFSHIREKFYGGNNRKFAIAIGENENILSAMCSGSRNIGLTTILKVLDAHPDIDANWLLGRIPSPESKPYSRDEEETAPMVAAEESESNNGRPEADSVPWSRYDAAQQEIGALRTRLEQSAESVARLLKENSELRKNPVSPSPATPKEPIFA